MKRTVTLLGIVILGFSTTTSSVAAANRVLSLGCNEEYMEVPDADCLDLTTAITIEAWVKHASDDFKAWEAIVAKGNHTWRLHITKPFPSQPLRATRGVAFHTYHAGRFFLLDSGVEPEKGKWYHVAATFDGHRSKIYVDGQLKNSRGGFRLGKDDHPLGIGTNTELWNSWTGLIDEVRVWSVARSEEQIQTTMYTTLTGQEDGLVGYWNFDDGTPRDLSRNRNHGALRGDARIVEASLPDEFIHPSLVAIGDRIVNPGDQFTTNISGRMVEELCSFAFEVTFDPSILQAIEVKEGAFLSRDGTNATSWQAPTIDNEKGIIGNVRCGRPGKDGVRDGGVLASVTFEAVDVGSTDLTLQKLRLLPPTGEEMKTSARRGSVDVYPHRSISGSVRDVQTKTPISGARVSVSRNGFSFGFFAYSDNEGKYTIEGVPVGDFDVTASSTQLPYVGETTRVPVKQGQETSNVVVELKPPYVPKGKLTYIDLQSKANRKLAERTFAGPEGNNLKELPAGEQTFGGVKFGIGEGMIQLAPSSFRTIPVKVEGIPVNKKFARLYIFHGALWGTGNYWLEDGTAVAEYKVHYEDNTIGTIPVVYGESVRHWWDSSNPVSRGKVVWEGSNAAARKANRRLRLYIMMWKNPQPHKKVISIDYVSRNTPAAPFCVGMTMEAASGPSGAEDALDSTPQ